MFTRLWVATVGSDDTTEIGGGALCRTLSISTTVFAWPRTTGCLSDDVAETSGARCRVFSISATVFAWLLTTAGLSNDIGTDTSGITYEELVPATTKPTGTCTGRFGTTLTKFCVSIGPL